ncbi:gamma-glutamylcyclotransferase [Roseicyclus marinus]|uniref:gamma-glutamylcyclotransferase n=1 Tax=Roseicyclus marinus TaxID=2161673 RepID=UPI00240F920D|nr:gamma-glutamylcyclotransferase [Roseicyclus marinus]MDG3043099.1 gamma-glutamylcyclotransferase [Roseicyclus marinus]
MERTADPFFFGYGSLVNRATHVYAPVRAARARGWARIWRGTSLRQVAYLSAIEAPGVEIEGLIAPVPGGDWAALDKREAAYGRHNLQEVDHDLPGPAEVMIYKVEPEHVAEGGTHPILLSYLDVVVQGYLREFGAAGVARFFETTGGWDMGVLDDRAAPRYPRAQVTSDRERGMVDAALRDLGVGFR